MKNLKKNVINKYPLLSPQFIFLYPAYNLIRNNEISANIGLNQLKTWIKTIKLEIKI